jgi:hypothetical protein
MRIFLVAFLAVAVLLSGCTDKLSFAADGGTLAAPAFSVTPETGGKDTVFTVDAGKLGEKYNLTWDWGDGTVTYGKRSEHKYGFTNGVMTVTLVATDEAGTQGLALRTVKLGTGENADPTVTVRAAKTWIEARKPLNLTATGRDTDRDPLSYLWTYSIVSGGASGDGHAHDHGSGGAAPPAAAGQEFVIDGKDAKTSVTFDAAGKYLVKVRASDPKGGQAIAETTIDVSAKIPDAQFQTTYEGTLNAGSAGAGVSEKLWDLPAGEAPDTNVDAVRHPLQLRYPANLVIILQWNDTAASQTGMSASDLDLAMRDVASGEIVFASENRAQPGVPPVVPPPFEFNVTQVPAGDYEIIVRGYVAAQATYVVTVFASLQLTPELVAQVEGG